MRESQEMNKTKFIIILWIVTVIGSSLFTGYVVYINTKPDVIVQKPDPKPVVAPPVEREVPIKDMSCDLVKSELWHYENDPMKIDWYLLDQTNEQMNLEIQGTIYKRSFSQEANIGINIVERNTGNWKLVLGFSAGTVFAVGTSYVVYRLFIK